MAVYVVNNIHFVDRNEYDIYAAKFLSVMRRFDGEVLAVQDTPVAFEGEWPFDRTVILRFASRAELQRFHDSPEYQQIAVHRQRGAKSNVVILDGFDFRRTG